MFRRWPGHLVTKSSQVWNWFTVNCFPENSSLLSEKILPKSFWLGNLLSNCPWLPHRVAPFPILAFPMGDEGLAGFEKLPPSVGSQIQIRDIAPIWESEPKSCIKIFSPKHFHIFHTICGIHGSSVQITNDLCPTTTTFSDNYLYHYHHQYHTTET